MCTNADKDNISVLTRRSEYITHREELLNNVENFDILDQDHFKKSAHFAGTFSSRASLASLSAPRARDSIVALRAP